MTTTATEKCFSNIDIIENICKFLHFKDQCELLNATKELEYIIINGIWRSKYKEVEVINNGKGFLVSNKINTLLQKDYNLQSLKSSRLKETNNTILDFCETQKFFKFNKQNIKKLNIRNIFLYLNENFKFPLKPAFENLIYISFVDVTLEDKELQHVADNCKKLKTLNLSRCRNRVGNSLYLDDYIRIDTFKSMRNLKILNITRMSCSYTYFKDFLNHLNLEEFILKYEIKPSKDANKNDINLEKLKAFKVLEIGIFLDEKDYLHFQQHFLPNFENLCRLNLRSVRITNNFFDIISKFCKQLTHLNFEECEFEIFKPLPMLKELYIYFCHDLSWKNLKTILSEMNLKCFSTSYTEYNGTFEYFHITPKLQEIHFLTDSKEELKLLDYNQGKLNELNEIHLNYRDTNYNVNLPNIAPNLKVLYITPSKEMSKYYVKLKSLKTLFCSLFGNIDINEFQRLLTHENLNILTIECNFSNIKTKQLKQPIKTNLHYLNIMWSELKEIFDYVCDLLCLNRKLTLICHQIDADIISDIVCSVKFPKHCEVINVCGFFIDCHSIKKNCTETLDELKLIIETFRELFLLTYFILQ